MFKSGRWKKGQNNKIKVMFQMQFQAIQVPKMKEKGLMIAIISADTEKPLAKLKRIPIVDGTCTWEEPVYETVKFFKDQKTETFKERIYYFNVQTGSSKSGFVGEVGVDFANFAEATEPVQLSLPLTTANSSPILRVFIQKIQTTDELRLFKENESLLSESSRSRNQASDWSLGSFSERSMPGMLKSPRHNTEASKTEIHALKSEVSRLERHIELSELELESFRKQIMKTNKRSQDLMTKMDELKEKKEAAERECDETIEELNYEKNLNQKLVIIVEDFERTTEGKDKEISCLSENFQQISLDCKLLRQENHEFKNDIQDLMKVKIEKEERVKETEEALKLELKMVRSDYCELQQRLLVTESEKHGLQKKVYKLEQKHENLLTKSIVACDVTTSKHDESKHIRNNEQIHSKLLSEISSLDERNKQMEIELKEMQEKYSEVSLRFAEVESERQQLVMALRNVQNGKKK